jgi:hypothetical protein
MLALLWALIQRVELTERGMNEESLLRWIQSRVTSPHAQINSFADCLREPQFLAAFINSFTEGSAVVFAVPSSQPTLKEMMQIAEQRLGILSSSFWFCFLSQWSNHNISFGLPFNQFFFCRSIPTNLRYTGGIGRASS